MGSVLFKWEHFTYYIDLWDEIEITFLTLVRRLPGANELTAHAFVSNGVIPGKVSIIWLYTH